MTIRNDATRTRIPIKEKRRPRAVVARQGQVLLDTDFDQQSRHQLERIEIETRDSLGSPGRVLVPAGNDGFTVPDGALANFDIKAGRGYLDGWLLENADDCKLQTQPHPRTGSTLTTPRAIALKALVRHIDPVEEPKLADPALGDAQASGRALIDWQVFPFDITGGGVVTCATIASKPGWQALAAPSTGTLTLFEQAATPSTDPCSLTPGGGYTRLENLCFRFEVHGGVANAAFPIVDGPRFGLHNLKIKVSHRNASAMVRIDTITNAEIKVVPPALDPRNWFAPGQYAEIVSIHDDVDPRAALANERLFPVAFADDDRVVLDATAAEIAAIGAAGDGTWFLRLWDAFPDGSGVATVSAPSGAALSAEIPLGDGLSIKLGAGTFRRGDYWNCSARAEGSTDWPKTGGVPDAMSPHGPEVRYAPLAAVTAPGTSSTEDCRIPFATLSDRALLYRGGDGQAIFADPALQLPPGSGMFQLPAKARVAVMRGETPVPRAFVRWSFVGPTGGSCLINGSTCNGTTSIDTPTTDDGLAEVTWSIDGSKRLALHQIQAALVMSPTATSKPPIVFNAVFETAAHTGYAPGQCTHLAGVDNVQTALDVLCSQIDEKADSVLLRSITLFDSTAKSSIELIKEKMILNALEVRYDSFLGGIAFGFESDVSLTISPKEFDPIVEVELDLPYPTTDADRLYWSDASGGEMYSSFAFQRFRLDGTATLTLEKRASGNPGLMWRPSNHAQKFIASAPIHQWGQKINPSTKVHWVAATPQRILCRIRLRSPLIFGKGRKEIVYLNAEHLGVFGPVTGRELLVGDRDPQRAGDLEIFIYLMTEKLTPPVLVTPILESVPVKPNVGTVVTVPVKATVGSGPRKPRKTPTRRTRTSPRSTPKRTRGG